MRRHRRQWLPRASSGDSNGKSNGNIDTGVGGCREQAVVIVTVKVTVILTQASVAAASKNTPGKDQCGVGMILKQVRGTRQTSPLVSIIEPY